MLLFLALQAAVQSPLAARPDTLHPAHNALHYDITLVVPATPAATSWAEVETDLEARLQSSRWRCSSTTAFRVVRVLINGKPNTRLFRTMWGRPGGEVVIPHERQGGRHPDHPGPLPRPGQRRPHHRAEQLRRPHRVRRQLARPGASLVPHDGRPRDKATVAFHVQAPLGDQVIANGVLETIDTLAYGHATWHYRLDTRCRSIPWWSGIARMARTRLPDAACAVKCVPLTVWTYPQDSAYAVTGPFRRVGQIVEYFSSLIGPFPYPESGPCGVQHPLRRNGKLHRDLLRREAVPEEDLR